MRKGQFIFNFLRDYMGEMKSLENPYPKCHWILFNISDENWDIIEKEYKHYKSLKKGQTYCFPEKPFGETIISKEHRKAMSTMFEDLEKFGFDSKI